MTKKNYEYSIKKYNWRRQKKLWFIFIKSISIHLLTNKQFILKHISSLVLLDTLFHLKLNLMYKFQLILKQNQFLEIAMFLITPKLIFHQIYKLCLFDARWQRWQAAVNCNKHYKMKFIFRLLSSTIKIYVLFNSIQKKMFTQYTHQLLSIILCLTWNFVWSDFIKESSHLWSKNRWAFSLETHKEIDTCLAFK
jgi:hypothetical protein